MFELKKVTCSHHDGEDHEFGWNAMRYSFEENKHHERHNAYDDCCPLHGNGVDCNACHRGKHEFILTCRKSQERWNLRYDDDDLGRSCKSDHHRMRNDSHDETQAE